MRPVKTIETTTTTTARSKHLDVESKSPDIPVVESGVTDFPREFGPTSSEDLVSIADISRLLLNNKVFISLFTLLTTLLAVASFFLATPMYRADVKLVPVTEGDLSAGYSAQLGDLGGLAVLAGIDTKRGSQRQEAVATLGSRLLTMNFIEAEQLTPVLLPDESSDDEPPSLWDAYVFFDKKIRSIYDDRRAGLVTLSIDWKDAEQASAWANQLVHRTNELLRSRAIAESNAAIAYLSAQLKKTSVVELQQVIHRLIEAEMKKVILANISTEYAFKIVDPAVVAEKSFKPLLIPRLVLGVSVGLILSFFIVLLLNTFKTRNLIRS